MGSALSPKERQDLDLILEDLKLLFERDSIDASEVDRVVGELKSVEVRDYANHLRGGSKPEVALREAFFAGRSLLSKYLAEEINPEVSLGEGVIDYQIGSGGRFILLELKSLFEAETVQVKAGRELKMLRQRPLRWEDHRAQVLKYIRKGGKYIVLTNLKEWCFFNDECSPDRCIPFRTTELFSFLKDFEVSQNLFERLERYDFEAIREELDKKFFESLKAWVKKISEVKFTVDEKRKLEVIISAINKFVFIQTLDDYGVIDFRWIKNAWDHAVQRWSAKGKLQVLREFFREVTEWFYEYYDTELFRDNVLKHVKQDSVNVDLFYRNLELVLGLAYWQTPLGGFKGIMQYNFKFIDEDIFGKAYETFLAEVRKEQGIYYTPRYVTERIVNQTVGMVLNNIVEKVDRALQKEDFENVKKLAEELISIKVLDPACGSGSFLIKALRRIFRHYTEFTTLLQSIISKHNQFNGTLDRPREVEKNVEILMRLQELVGADSKRELISKILVRHIYGNDLDVKALEVAKVNLWLEAIKLAPKEFRFDRLPSETNHILPDLEMNLGNGDSLYSLSFETVVDQLGSDRCEELRKLSELRNEYLKDPTKTDLVEKISQLKHKLRETLNETLERHVQERCTRPNQLEVTTPFFWPLEFWFVFFNDEGKSFSEEERGFDIVIGNPPYYTETRGYKEKFRLYACSQLVAKYYEPKMDVFYFFIELGIDLLRPKGKLGFIIMQYWSSRGSGKVLRKKIMDETTVTGVINFNEFKVFEEAKGQHNSVLVLAKEKPPGNTYNVSTIEVTNPSTPKEEVVSALLTGVFTENVTKRELTLTYNAMLGKIIFLPKEYAEIVEKITSRSNYQISADQISQGVVLPQDKVTDEQMEKLSSLREGEGIFLLSDEEVRSMALTKAEKTFLQPFYWARQIDSFYYEDQPAGWLIYTTKKYIDDDDVDVNKRSRAEGRTKESVRKEVLAKVHKKYPTITAHLDRFRNVITSDRRPYGIHRSRQKEVFLSNKKIVSVRKTRYPKFVWIPKPYFMDESANYIEPDEKIDPGYLASLCNSSLMWFWYRYGTQKTHGTQLQVDIEIIKSAPLIRPPNNRDISLLSQLSQNAYDLKKARLAYLNLWKTSSIQMMNTEKTLYEILKEDRSNLRDGRLEDCWTHKASSYPQDLDESSEDRFEYFLIEVSDPTLAIAIHGVDGEGRLSVVYEMTFEQKELMTHVYCALLSSDVSRWKTLSELLRKTKIPVIRPNSAKRTGNIIKRVSKDFKFYLANEKLDIPPDLDDIENKLRETMAQIDAIVFHLYELSPEEVQIVLNSLEHTVRYRQKVLDHLATITERS